MHDWMQQAACRGCATDLFFNELGDSQTFRDTLYVCNGGTRTHKDGRTYTTETKPGCPVKQQCLDYAMSFPTDQDQYGIFGGCTPNQRDLIRRDRRRIEREPRVEQDCAREQNCGRIERDSEPESAVSTADPLDPVAGRYAEPVPVGTIRGPIDSWRANLAELFGHLHVALGVTPPAEPTRPTAITS